MNNDLSQVVDALPGLVWTARPDGYTDFTNQRWRDYTGLTFEEALGQGWLAAIHPDDLQGLVSSWSGFLATGQAGEVEARMRRFDGVYRRFHFSTAPLVDGAGQIERWCGINTDIEDRRQAEDALLAEEQRFHGIVDGLPAVVVLMKPDGQFEHANHHMLEYLGATLDELKGRAFDFNWRFSFHPDDREEILSRWKHSIQTGDPYDHEGRLRRADGVYRWFQIRGFPLRDVAGRIIVWYLLQTDIDDRKRAEKLLAGERRLLELIVQGEALPAALTQLCLLVEDLCTSCVACSILLLDPGTQKLWHAASPSVPDDYTSAIDGFVIGPEVSACGTAAYHRQQVIATDIATDPRWREFRDAAISNGLEACWSTPILSQEGAVLGTFAMFSGKPGNPTAYDQEVIAQVTHLASIAIERERSQASLTQALVDLRGSEGLLAEEKRLLEMVAGGDPLQTVLNALCELVEATASGSYCAVVLVDPAGTHLQHGAAPSLPEGYSQAISGRPVNDESGPCAAAVFRNEQVIADDVPSETRWTSYAWPSLALANGLKACWSTPIAGASGRPVGAFAIYYTEPMCPTPQHQALIARFTHIASIAIARAESDAALRRSEAFLTQAQHLSLTCSFSWRVPTEEISWSQEAYRIFEFDSSQPVTNELIYSRIHPEDAPALFDFMDRARRGELIDFKYDHRLVMPDGSVKYVTMVAHGHRGKDGELEYLAAVQDVTQRRVSEETLGAVRAELARVARVTSLGALTASIAHEVNQPLSGIVTNASTCLMMLAADPPNVAGARETARRTIRDGNRAADVITRLRALFTKKEVAIEALDLNEATQEVLALLAGELRRARVVLRTEFAPGLPPILGDRVQLQQVMLNLLLNAADAMAGVEDRPRQLFVTTGGDASGCIRLEVKDAGSGLATEVADRLFEPFYTTKSGGMGIGLSISRSIIESHNGRLWASPNEGPGATFAFSVPSSAGVTPLSSQSKPRQRPSRVDRNLSTIANVSSQ